MQNAAKSHETRRAKRLAPTIVEDETARPGTDEENTVDELGSDANDDMQTQPPDDTKPEPPHPDLRPAVRVIDDDSDAIEEVFDEPTHVQTFETQDEDADEGGRLEQDDDPAKLDVPAAAAAAELHPPAAPQTQDEAAGEPARRREEDDPAFRAARAAEAAADALRLPPPAQINFADPGFRNGKPFDLADPATLYYPVGFGQEDAEPLRYQLATLTVEIPDDHFSKNDPASVEYRRSSAWNWIAVLMMLVIQRVTEFAGGPAHDFGAPGADRLTTIFHETLASDCKGMLEFTKRVVRERPYLKPFRKDLLGTGGLLSVLGTIIADLPENADSKLARDDPMVLWHKITAKWHSPVLAIMLSHVYAVFPMKNSYLSVEKIGQALHCIGDLTAERDPVLNRQLTSEFRVIFALKTLMSYNMVTFQTMVDNKWQLALTARRMRCWPLTLHNELLNAVSQVTCAPIAPEDHDWIFIGSVAATYFTNYTFGIREAKDLYLTWASNEHPAQMYDKLKVLRVRAAKVKVPLIDTLIFAELKPLQNYHIRHGQYDDFLGLPDIEERTTHFFENVLNAERDAAIEAEWGSFPARDEKGLRAAGVLKRELYEPPQLHADDWAKVWWTVPDFATREAALLWGWKRFCDDAPYMAAALCAAQFHMKRIPEYLLGATEHDCKTKIVKAITTAATFGGNNVRDANWRYIKQLLPDKHGNMPVCLTPDARRASWGYPATAELGHWARALASSGPNEEFVQVVPLRLHLIKAGLLSHSDIDGMAYVTFARHPKVDTDFFLYGLGRARPNLAKRHFSLRPDLKVEGPECVTSPGLADYLKKNDEYVRQLFTIVPNYEQGRANDMFAWTTSFGFCSPTLGGGQPVAWGRLVTTANVRDLKPDARPKWRSAVHEVLTRAKSPTVAGVDAKHLDEYLAKHKRFDVDALGPRYRNIAPDATESVMVNRTALARGTRGGEKTSIFVERAGPDGKGAYMTFEETLLRRFPLLFPYGAMPVIAGKTLREKAMNLLKIFDPIDKNCWTGLSNFVGPVAGTLHLFLYTIIEEGRVSYRMSMEKYNTYVPEGEQISVHELRDVRLPTFDAYWKELKHDAQGLYALHGAPSLLLTFTANEHQLPEPYRVEIQRLGFSVSGPDAAPLRAIYFAEQLKKLRALNWKAFCAEAGLPPLKGYCWRTESQERGNLHQHLCLFFGINNELDNSMLDRICSAHWPPLGTTTFRLVKGLQIHRCGERCKNRRPDPETGEVRDTCSFRYPHPVSDHFFENEGWCEMPRTKDETWLSEWLAVGLTDLESHCHCRIISTRDDAAVSYVLGYCFKTESPTRYVDTRSELGKVLATRAVSLSLATYMMFSNWMASVSVHVKTLPLVHPSRETAAFRRRAKGGAVVCGLNPMRQYFARARAYEHMTYAEYHSWISVRKRKPKDILPDEPEPQMGPADYAFAEPDSLAGLRRDLFDDFTPEEDPQGAGEIARAAAGGDDPKQVPAADPADGETGELGDDEDLDAEDDGSVAWPLHCETLHAEAARYAEGLVQVRLKTRQLISYRCLQSRSTVDDVAFAAVISCRPWRSYEQAKCGQKNWVDAAIHLGLFTEETVRPHGCVELVKQLVLRHTLDAEAVAVAIANLQDEYPLLDPVRLMHHAFTADDWGHQRERIRAIMTALPAALEDAGQRRDALEASDDEVDALLHRNADEQTLAQDAETLDTFMHRATAEQVQVLAWLAQRRADEHSYEDVIAYAQKCGRADVKFDPVGWPHLQRVLFCVGAAGTGKSFVIKACIAWLRLKNVPFVVLGSTGCAASLIDGITVHSAGGLYGDDDQIKSSITVDTARGRALAEAEVILTDEFGMISMGTAKGLSYTVDRLCRQRHHLSELMPERLPPFADKIVMFFGDLMQLPSVHPGEPDTIVAQRQIQLIDIFADAEVITLCQNMRVSPDDVEYMRFVNLARMQRQARLDRELIDILRTRIIDVGPLEDRTTEEILEAQVQAVARELADNPDWRCATVTHASADKMLDAVNKIKAEEQQIEFTHIESTFLSGHGIITWLRVNNHFWIRNVIGTPAKPWQRKWFVNQMKNPFAKMSKTVPLSLDLHIGQRIRIQKNVSMKAKIVNGTEAIVTDFILGDDQCEQVPLAIEIEVNGRSFALPRKEIASVTSWRGDPISRVAFPCSVLQQGTVNALQGATIKNGKLFLCMKDPMSRNALYVALTRLTRLDQLVIYGITEEQLDEYELRVNEDIDAISDAFEAAAQRGWTVTHTDDEGDAVVFPDPLPGDRADGLIRSAWARQADESGRATVPPKFGFVGPTVMVTSPLDQQWVRARWGFLPSDELTAVLIQAQASRRGGRVGGAAADSASDDGEEPPAEVELVRSRIAKLRSMPLDQLTPDLLDQLEALQETIELLEAEMLYEEEVARRDLADVEGSDSGDEDDRLTAPPDCQQRRDDLDGDDWPDDAAPESPEDDVFDPCVPAAERSWRSAATAALCMIPFVAPEIAVNLDPLFVSALDLAGDWCDPADEFFDRLGYDGSSPIDPVDFLFRLHSEGLVSHFPVLGRLEGGVDIGAQPEPEQNVFLVWFGAEEHPETSLVPRSVAASRSLQPGEEGSSDHVGGDGVRRVRTRLMLVGILLADPESPDDCEAWLYAPNLGQFAWMRFEDARTYRCHEVNLFERLGRRGSRRIVRTCVYARWGNTGLDLEHRRMEWCDRPCVMRMSGPDWPIVPAAMCCFANLSRLADLVADSRDEERDRLTEVLYDSLFGTGNVSLDEMLKRIPLSNGPDQPADVLVTRVAEWLSAELGLVMSLWPFIEPGDNFFEIAEFLGARAARLDPSVDPIGCVVHLPPRPLELRHAYWSERPAFGGLLEEFRWRTFTLQSVIATSQSGPLFVFLRDRNGNWWGAVSGCWTLVSDSFVDSLLSGTAEGLVATQLYFDMATADHHSGSAERFWWNDSSPYTEPPVWLDAPGEGPVTDADP
jgi:hypothetical protein